MTVTSTRHGLSVYTGADATHGADTADNRRLHRPVDEAVSNTFNDATSGHRYDHPAGHEGIDFACGTGTDVRAMYGGIVVKIETGHQSYGTLVTVRSCTDPAKGVGFEHTYAHLQSTAASLKVGDSVAKGDRIGVSGTTGTTDAHLHVHLKAFGPDGTITKDDELGWDGVTVDHKRYTDVASRILGCLNFACFLPPDNSADAPPINENFPLAPDRKLLSPRDAFDTEIPVFVNRFDNYNSAKSYSPNSTETNSAGEEEFRTYPAYVWGKEIACYTVLEHYPVNSNNPTWYKIRHSDWKNGKIVGVIEGWVPSHGRVRERKPGTTSTDDKGLFHDNVAWVQVENAPATMPEVQTRPHFATTDTAAVKVHSLPSTTGSSVRARLTAGRCHAITGVYWDRAVIVPDTPRRWWLLQYGTDANDRPLTGWVRGEEVWAYGDETGVTAYTGPADNPRPAPGVPREVAVLPVAESVTVSWKPPANAAAGVRGYRIWRGRSPESLKKIHQARAGTTSWTDQPTTPLGTLYYYAVSAYRIEIEGERSPAVGIITGHGPLDGTKTLAVAERNTHIRPTANTGPNSLAVMLDSVFHEVKGVLWKNGQPGFLAVEVPPTRLLPTAREGWVPASAVKVLGTDGTPVTPASTAGIRRLAPVAARSHLRLRSWVTGLHLRTGPSTAFAIHRLLTDTGAWYEVTGRTATTPVWYRLRYDATFQGWVHGDYVELSESAPAVAPVTPPALPAETGPAHETGTGTGTTTGSAAGDYRNLVTNPDGRWAVDKNGTTVTANFNSPRSPVQYYARQNPQPQFVLPAGFRPAAPVTRTVTGSQVREDRTPVPNAPRVAFDLTIGTNGELRYVNNSKVDHLGFVSYNVTALKWQSREALTVPTAPARPGDIKASGTYLNQQVNRGSSWKLQRRGNAVSGSFGCTRSPVDYFANGRAREAQLLLPADYRPRANARFRVKGAVRVNQDGSDSTDRRKVDFWLTVRPNGQMWYDADTNLRTLGVGYLRYTVNVSWTAAPRITVPGVPRDLQAEDIEATELELRWREPAADGGASVDGYRIQVWDADDAEWDTEESNTRSTRTRHDVDNLAPYTTHRFRVAAHNRAGWGAFGPAVTATTRRRAPGTPASLSATAAHDAATLTWGAASGTVTGYTLARRTGSGTWDILVDDTGTTARGFVDRTVRPSTTYRYRVRGHNRGRAGAWSRERSATTAAVPTIPGRVAGLAVAPGTASRLRLTWTAPTDTGGGLTGHRIERSPDTAPRTWTVVREDTGSAIAAWDDNDVAADTVYHYRVGARNRAGVGTPSTEARGRTRPRLHLGGRLPYPLTARAEPRADAPATATWNAFLPGRAHDLVARLPDPDGWWRVLLLDRNAQGPFWLPAAAGTAAGDVASLPQPPGAPRAFTASLAAGRVTLAWTAPDAGGTVTGYRLWRQEGDGAFARLGADLAATVLAHADATVRNERVYRYWLQATSAEGPGVPTATAALAVMATPAVPDAVTGVTAASAAAGTALQLAWQRAATGGLPAGYRVAWRESGTTVDFRDTAVTGTAHALTELVPGTAYEIHITAFNQEGDAAATRHAASTELTAPGVPEAVAVAVAGQDATATWDRPITGGRPDAYHLQVKTRTTAAWPTTHTTVTGLTHNLTGLGYAVAHDLRLRAANSAGPSAWVETNFTTDAQPRLPDAPASLTAAPGADSQMQLTWQAAAAGGTPTGYRIERSADVTPRAWTDAVADTGNTDTAWHDRGRAPDTAYRYRVTARNAAGLGPPSAEAAGRTRPQATLATAATYPLTAHRWPETTAPVSHTWPTRDTAVLLDVAGQAPGGGWFRLLRFGHRASGPYWLPAAAVTVTGATADLPQAPGAPGNPTAIASADTVTLTWTAPAAGGAVTGYRLWRQAGTAAWTVLTDTLAADAHTHTDTGLVANTAYRYRLQARSAAGHGPRTAVLTPAAAGPAPAPPVLTLYAHPGRATLIVRGADGTVRQALAWSGPLTGSTTLAGRSGYHRLVVPAGGTLTVRARSQNAAGRWSAWTTRTLATR